VKNSISIPHVFVGYNLVKTKLVRVVSRIVNFEELNQSPSMGMSSDSDWLIILLLLIPTLTFWFSLDCIIKAKELNKQNPNMEAFLILMTLISSSL